GHLDRNTVHDVFARHGPHFSAGECLPLSTLEVIEPHDALWQIGVVTHEVIVSRVEQHDGPAQNATILAGSHRVTGPGSTGMKGLDFDLDGLGVGPSLDKHRVDRAHVLRSCAPAV